MIIKKKKNPKIKRRRFFLLNLTVHCGCGLWTMKTTNQSVYSPFEDKAVNGVHK